METLKYLAEIVAIFSYSCRRVIRRDLPGILNAFDNNNNNNNNNNNDNNNNNNNNNDNNNNNNNDDDDDNNYNFNFVISINQPIVQYVKITS
mgnify:CR=1 FL=1